MIPKAVWLIKDKRSMWLFGSKVSCLIGCVCCVTVHWYSELEHSHNTEYFLYSRYRTCSQTAMFQLECKSLFLKEPFCTWVARVNEIVKRSNKSQTTLRGEKKNKNPASSDGYKNNLQTICCDVTSPLFTCCQVCSWAFCCFVFFSSLHNKKKGDLDRLKAWRSVSLQSS